MISRSMFCPNCSFLRGVHIKLPLKRVDVILHEHVALKG